MRGPIDYIIVGFDGNNFDGSILKAIADASEKKIISVLALSVISKDDSGNVSTLDVANLGDEYVAEFTQTHISKDSPVTQEDIEEVGEILEPNTTAGFLVVEQLWAKPLKEALINANGTLLAEGRIHPEAAAELES
jgi:uncharacterized membrane protein